MVRCVILSSLASLEVPKYILNNTINTFSKRRHNCCNSVKRHRRVSADEAKERHCKAEQQRKRRFGAVKKVHGLFEDFEGFASQTYKLEQPRKEMR
jgi:hypothetical protein